MWARSWRKLENISAPSFSSFESHKLNFFLDNFWVFRNGANVSRATDFILDGRKQADIQERLLFKKGCELLSSEEGVFKGRGTAEVIITVAETPKTSLFLTAICG